MLHRLLSIYDAATQRYAIYATLQKLGDITLGNASNSDKRNAYILLSHLSNYIAVTNKAEDGRKATLGCGITKWSTTKVVGCATLQGAHDILETIYRSTYDISLNKNHTCLTNGHITLAKVHAVGTYPLSKQHVVVDDKGCSVRPAHLLHRERHLLQQPFLCTLHAELNPAATTLQSYSRRVDVRVAGVVVGDEL